MQSLVQLCKPPKLQLCHGLLLAFAIVVCADLERGRHGVVAARSMAMRFRGRREMDMDARRSGRVFGRHLEAAGVEVLLFRSRAGEV